MTYLLPEEIKSLFRVIKSPRDRAIFRLLHFFPWGLTEITRLQLANWDDGPDLRFPRITVPWARRFWTWEFDLRPRHTHPRQAQAVANAIRAWLRIRGRTPGPLFTSNHGAAGGRMKRTQIIDLLLSYAEEAGLPPDKATLQNIRSLGDFERMEEATWRMRDWR
jgi:integrase